MPGAPPTSTVRSVGRSGQGLEGAVVPANEAATAKGSNGRVFQYHWQCIHNAHGRLHHSGTLSAGNQLSRWWSTLRRSVLFSALQRHQKAFGTIGTLRRSGGLPIYKNGLPAGGIGIEGDGLYTVDRNPTDNDQPFEEQIAASGIRGFEAPASIRGDTILVDGIRLPFSNIASPLVPTAVASIVGATISLPTTIQSLCRK